MQHMRDTFVKDILTQVVSYLKKHPELLEMKTTELIQHTNKVMLNVDTSAGGDIGVIIHYGLYSMPAFDSNPSRRSIKNGSEWYLKRLMETNNYRPISGWKETQAHHAENYGEQDYFDFKDMITITEEKVQRWVQQAVVIGAKYVIITTRHHEGVCLWPSKVGLHLEQDVVGWVAKHTRAAGLKFGAYYSWIEWPKSFTKVYMEEVVEPQIDELQKKYKPDIFWFDGYWSVRSQVTKDKVTAICKKLKKANPKVEINDRGEESLATFRTFEKHFPEGKVKGPWEYIDTIGDSWGYNASAKKEGYKSGKILYELYTKAARMGGRFTINIGPKGDGSLGKNESNSLKEFATFLQKEE